MQRTLKSLLVAGVAALAVGTFAPTGAQAQDGEPIRVALGDLPEMETLMFLVGLERAKERGIEADVTFFAGEELAIQAIVAGQADLGVGSPYAVIQRAAAPVRMFYQISRIVFFPVAQGEIKTWQDMEGKSLTYHQRGGPLEPLAKIVTDAEGVTLGRPNYVPGSENRVVALTQGHIDAALIDLLNKNMMMENEPGKYTVLPWTDEVVTDEALFARQEWLEGSTEQVTILVEELLRTAQDVCKDPQIIADEREKYNLLPDLPQELSDIIASYHQEAIAAKPTSRSSRKQAS